MFKEITKEEMAAWDSLVNYISMVEAFKEGPHSTTPLRICMNSSLKQPYPVQLSLNDCLIKGPSALVDLFTVTLCIREHRFALTKDLSKFYQRLDANPIAQNLRRVMWRGGDTSTEMKVYITTTVNFGDKPAGCIAIATARETAAMDEASSGRPHGSCRTGPTWTTPRPVPIPWIDWKPSRERWRPWPRGAVSNSRRL